VPSAYRFRGHSNSKPARTIGVGETLTTHADVAEASVIGVDDDAYGQRLVAFVVLEHNSTGSTAAPAEALKAHVRENLANYKVPRDIHVLDELPRNITGKVLRRELQAPRRLRQWVAAAPCCAIEPPKRVRRT
jgi:acyl-coenzyme A synthetase/AMP-(fatty) acid ligase